MNEITNLASAVSTLATTVNQLADQSIKNINLSMQLVDKQREYLVLLHDELDTKLVFLQNFTQHLKREREEYERMHPMAKWRRQHPKPESVHDRYKRLYLKRVKV